jgi:hypothetical protein
MKESAYDLYEFAGGSIETYRLLFHNAILDQMLVYTTHFQSLQIFFPGGAL